MDVTPQQPFQLKATDDLMLHTQTYPIETPKALVCLVHGFGEHHGRYTHVIRALNEAGFQVITYDHRGHGLSEGKRGHAPSFKQFLLDLDCVISHGHSEINNELPLLLYGHSMGGGIVLNYALSTECTELKNNRKIDAILASSPWLTLTNPPNVLKDFGIKLLEKILPSLTLPTNMDAAGISRSHEVVKAYLEDPLVHNKISPKLFIGLHEASKTTFERARYWNKPLLISHGDADPVTNFASSAALISKIENQQKIDSNGQKSTVSLKAWPGAFHELHNELQASKVLNFHMEWLKDCLRLSYRK